MTTIDVVIFPSFIVAVFMNSFVPPNNEHIRTCDHATHPPIADVVTERSANVSIRSMYNIDKFIITCMRDRCDKHIIDLHDNGLEK